MIPKKALINEDLPFYITIPENILGYEGVSFVSEGVYDNFGTKYIYMVVILKMEQ